MQVEREQLETLEEVSLHPSTRPPPDLVNV